MHLTRPLKVLNILRIVSTRLSPLCDEMSLAADSDERKLYLRLLGTRLFYFLHGRFTVWAGKWWTEFRTDEFWFRSVIAFTICLSQFRLMKNGRESLKLIFKKGLKTWNPNFRLKVSNQEDQENRRMPFQTFRLFQEFSTETSKATRNWVNGKPGKAPKCLLSLF